MTTEAASRDHVGAEVAFLEAHPSFHETAIVD